MKTAEQWSMELAEKLVPDTMDAEGQADTRLPYIKAIDIVKQIQLDAYKAGMSEAAEIAKNKQIGCLTMTYRLACNEIDKTILSARDRKASL